MFDFGPTCESNLFNLCLWSNFNLGMRDGCRCRRSQPTWISQVLFFILVAGGYRNYTKYKGMLTRTPCMKAHQAENLCPVCKNTF